jgi:hypothetical protein
MHLFIRQYEKLQFDRESSESYEEKRTSLVWNEWPGIKFIILSCGRQGALTNARVFFVFFVGRCGVPSQCAD